MADTNELIEISRELSAACAALDFHDPVAHVYNPLDYAWQPHRQYLERYGGGPGKVVLLGMNPGPWGMAQTGVPFGDIPSVRDWLGINAQVRAPEAQHPKRPIEGFDCSRREVSGTRLWGLFAERFGTPESFFRRHFVANYCPLAFLSRTGSNITPDKIAAQDRKQLLDVCDRFLILTLRHFEAEWAIGIGKFTRSRILRVHEELGGLQVGVILHPSPASPAANRDWAGKATRQLVEMGVWARE